METRVNSLTGRLYNVVELPDGLGTLDIMDWVDEHWNTPLQAVEFHLKHGLVAVVSDQDGMVIDAETHWDMTVTALKVTPHKCPNGWERIGDAKWGWYCKKEDKIIYITL